MWKLQLCFRLFFTVSSKETRPVEWGSKFHTSSLSRTHFSNPILRADGLYWFLPNIPWPGSLQSGPHYRAIFSHTVANMTALNISRFIGSTCVSLSFCIFEASSPPSSCCQFSSAWAAVKWSPDVSWCRLLFLDLYSVQLLTSDLTGR